MKKKFYITAAIPYVNAKPHIGHALEFVQADTVARYHKLRGEDVLLLSGGDENALKNVLGAEKAGVQVQEFVDGHNKNFRDLTSLLNCHFDVWQRGSDQNLHFISTQKLWNLCEKSGSIYKKAYTGQYCIGCETFYSPEELDQNGECSEHPGRKLDQVHEENYFFRLSKYQQTLIDLIESGRLEIVPRERKNEVLAFVKSGLTDLSISRSNERAKNWGVPVPGDSHQRIYVWFDALNIYQSGVGFGWNDKKYHKWWPADLHVIGKGITRFHAVYWPAFLLSAGLELPKKLFVHGYLTVDGQKMSKFLGNVVDPVPLINKYGVDSIRYYLLAKTSPFADGDFSEEKFINVYNADLANGLGNLAARIAKLFERANVQCSVFSVQFADFEEIRKFLDGFRFDEALKTIWGWISDLDQTIEKDKPWKLEGSDLEKVLAGYRKGILKIATALQPFLPQTAEKVLKQFAGPKIVSEAPLFPRLK